MPISNRNTVRLREDARDVLEQAQRPEWRLSLRRLTRNAKGELERLAASIREPEADAMPMRRWRLDAIDTEDVAAGAGTVNRAEREIRGAPEALVDISFEIVGSGHFVPKTRAPGRSATRRAR